MNRINKLIDESKELFRLNNLDAYIIKKRKNLIIGVPSNLSINNELFDYCLKFNPYLSIKRIYGGFIINNKIYTSLINHTCRTGLSSSYKLIPATALNFAITMNYLNKDEISTYTFQIIPHFLNAFHKAEKKAKVKIEKINDLFIRKLASDLDNILNDIETLTKEGDKDLLKKYHLILPGVLVNLVDLVGPKDWLVKRLSKKEFIPYLITSSREEYTENGYAGMNKLITKTFTTLLDNKEITKKEIHNYLLEMLKYNEKTTMKLVIKLGFDFLEFDKLVTPATRFNYLFMRM